MKFVIIGVNAAGLSEILVLTAPTRIAAEVYAAQRGFKFSRVLSLPDLMELMEVLNESA